MAHAKGPTKLYRVVYTDEHGRTVTHFDGWQTNRRACERKAREVVKRYGYRKAVVECLTDVYVYEPKPKG